MQTMLLTITITIQVPVLPLDKELETALLYRLDAKRCAVCGALFRPGSNRAKYCPACAATMNSNSGKYAGRAFLFQPAAENVSHVTETQWSADAQ